MSGSADLNRNRAVDWALVLYVVLAYAFVFAPIAASFVFSFNSDRFPSIPLGEFSLDWYRAVATDPLVWEGARNTLFVGVTVGVVSTALGFGAAYTDYRYKFAGKQVYLALALLPPTIPVIILGLAMLAYLSRINLSGNACRSSSAMSSSARPSPWRSSGCACPRWTPPLNPPPGTSARRNGWRCAM
jgi:spermidine/putrescine transport system permease protein